MASAVEADWGSPVGADRGDTCISPPEGESVRLTVLPLSVSALALAAGAAGADEPDPEPDDVPIGAPSRMGARGFCSSAAVAGLLASAPDAVGASDPDVPSAPRSVETGDAVMVLLVEAGR